MSLKTSLRKRLECPVCYEAFNKVQPKTLTCGHTVCGRCLNRLMAEQNDPYKANCPQCRSLCNIPRGGVKTSYIIADIANEFIRKKVKKRKPILYQPEPNRPTAARGAHTQTNLLCHSSTQTTKKIHKKATRQQT